MVALILIILLITSLFFIKNYGFCGVCAFFLLCGSVTDSAGILYGLDSYFSYYKLIVWILTFVFFFISIGFIMVKSTNRVFLKWYFYPFIVAVILMLISSVLKGANFAYISSDLIMTGIPFFCMWAVGRSVPGRGKVFFYMLLVHALISLIIILGRDGLAQINGFTYVYRIDDNSANYDIKSMIDNSLSIFEFNKYSIQKTGQFHNSNALGFFSAILICFGIGVRFKIIKTENFKRQGVISGLLLILGIILWFNSLTRGPIILLLFIFLYVYTRPWKIKRNLGTYAISMVILIVPILFFGPAILEYLFPKFDDVSYTGRVVGYESAYETILKNPLIGAKPGEFPPHIYTLKIMAYHGILAGIFITIPIFHILIISFKSFLKDIKAKLVTNSTFNLMLVATLYGVFFTNGIVSYVIFGITLSEVCFRNNISIYRKPKY